MEKETILNDLKKLNTLNINQNKSTNLKESEIIVYNMRELAKRLDNIRQYFPSQDDLINLNYFFNLNIFFFKRISKDDRFKT